MTPSLQSLFTCIIPLALAFGCGDAPEGRRDAALLDTSLNDIVSSDASSFDGASDVGDAKPPLGIPNEVKLENGLIVGGAPSEAALRQAKANGITTVIDLRQPNEPGVDEEKELLIELEITYVSIPIGGQPSLSEANALRLDEELGKVDPTKTLLHCASGNRAGAMLAIRAFFAQGQSPDDAIAFGISAGLTSLESSVRSRLSDACEDNRFAAQCS